MLNTQNTMLWLVVLVILAPVVLGLGVIFRRWTATYWIRRFRAKAQEAGCRPKFEQALNYRIDQAREGRRALEYGDVRNAYVEAQERP